MIQLSFKHRRTPVATLIRMRGGHAPDRVRETFLEAIDAFMAWEDDEPEPTVAYQENFVSRQITISEACGLLWNCKDICPRLPFDHLGWADLEIRRQTYAACAQAMLPAIRACLQRQKATAGIGDATPATRPPDRGEHLRRPRLASTDKGAAAEDGAMRRSRRHKGPSSDRPTETREGPI